MTEQAEQIMIINGEPRPYVEGLGIEALVAEVLPGRADQQSGGPAGVAVAVNGSVVPRAGWSGRLLQPGDRVEIVTAVQGG